MALIIQIFLFVLMVLYLYVFLKDVWQSKKELSNDGTFKNVFNFMMGFVTNFFDALGIGSFAPQTIFIKMFKLTRDDSYIPGTLNIANTTPVLFQGIIFITSLNKDMLVWLVVVVVIIASITTFKQALTKENHTVEA